MSSFYDDVPDGVIRVIEEMDRQDEKWGQQDHPDGTGGAGAAYTAEQMKAWTALQAVEGALTWRDILLEEVYEALAEDDPARLKAELDQVAAVAVQWGLSIDRRGEET